MFATIIFAGGNGGPPKFEEDVSLMAVSLLLVAPVCEEVFFRGLLQGFLLRRGYFGLSIVLPGILFSVMHVIPFYSAGPALLISIMTGALILGLIAGYFRAVRGSLLHAVLTHFWFNLVGYIAMFL